MELGEAVMELEGALAENSEIVTINAEAARVLLQVVQRRVQRSRPERIGPCSATKVDGGPCGNGATTIVDGAPLCWMHDTRPETIARRNALFEASSIKNIEHARRWHGELRRRKESTP